MSELRALGKVAGDYFAEGLGVIEGLHRAVARRTPAGRAHDAIAQGAYAAVRGAGRAATSAGARAAEAAGLREPTSSPPGVIAVSALNGLLGDRLAEERSALAVEMALHPPVVKDPTPTLAVFVHGLGENELAWRLGRAPTYGERLRADLGHTPLHLRYNTGLGVRRNGRLLSELLEDTVARWPMPVEEIVLVGHSMGGLVARHACACATITARHDHPLGWALGDLLVRHGSARRARRTLATSTGAITSIC